MSRIFVALSSFAESGDEPLKLLKESGFPFTINPTGKRLTADNLVAMAAGFEGIIAGLEPYTAEVLEQLPQLHCISRCGVGVDNIDLAAAAARDVTVCNTPDVVAQPVAELAVAMIFDLLRKLTWHSRKMREGRWERRTGNLLKGKIVGIIGLGRIGRRTAEMLRALDAKVIGYDLVPDEGWAQSCQVGCVSLNELLNQSDIVSLHLGSSVDQPFQLGSAQFARMKKGVLLINTARGQLVDEAALIEDLNSGQIGGAALDVYQSEPYSGSLTQMENVVLTPHIATLTEESRVEMEVAAVRNILEQLTVDSQQSTGKSTVNIGRFAIDKLGDH